MIESGSLSFFFFFLPISVVYSISGKEIHFDVVLAKWQLPLGEAIHIYKYQSSGISHQITPLRVEKQNNELQQEEADTSLCMENAQPARHCSQLPYVKRQISSSQYGNPDTQGTKHGLSMNFSWIHTYA